MIVGGGGVRTPQVTNGLLAKSKELKLEEITLLDIDKKRLDAIYKIVDQIRTSHQNVKDVKINYTLNNKKAFKDADLILFTVRVGNIQSRIIDEQVPLRYGVVGQETTGPGGFAMAMRTIPVILEYMKEIKETAPEAWILNLTNPAGLITQALNDAGYEKIIGICDSPSGLTEDIAAGLDLPLSELWFEYFGLNHLGWIKKIKHKNKDITEDVFKNSEALKRHGEAMISGDLIRMLSLIPNEYLLFYYQNTEVVNKVSDSGLSRAQLIDKLNKLLFERLDSLDQNSSPDPLTIYQRYIEARHGSYMQVETAGFNKDDIVREIWNKAAEKIKDGSYMIEEEPGGYAAIALSVIKGITGVEPTSIILNIKNKGAISCLEADDVVEIPTFVNENGIHGLTIDEVPEQAKGLLQAVKSFERLTIQASKNKSYNQAMQALTIHPLVPDAVTAQKILDDYLKEHGDYFPDLKK
ncbi:MAG: hypothetical protein ACOCQZ_01550 [Halanaerobium sp.]